jgi:hypothetical protein
MNGPSREFPKRKYEETDPPRWLMPWVSAVRTLNPSFMAVQPRIMDARITPVPPMPTHSML